MQRNQTIEIRWHNDYVSIIFGGGTSETQIDIEQYVGEIGFGSSLIMGGLQDGRIVYTFQDQDMEGYGDYLTLWVLIHLTSSGWIPTKHEKNMPHSIHLIRN